jgi:hypothetical protein
MKDVVEGLLDKPVLSTQSVCPSQLRVSSSGTRINDGMGKGREGWSVECGRSLPRSNDEVSRLPEVPWTVLRHRRHAVNV